MERSDQSLTFSSLLSATFESSANVVGMIFVGYLGVKSGIFTPTLKKIHAKLVLNLFFPCLLFSQIGGTIDLETIIRIWPLPVFCVLFAIISGFLGYFSGNILSWSKSRKKFIISATVFNNITAVPIGLIKAFVSTSVMQIFESKYSETAQETASRGTTYLLLSTLFVLIIRSFWTYFLPEDDDLDTSNHSLLPNQNPMTQVKPITLFSHLNYTNSTEATPLLLTLKGSSSHSLKILNLTNIKHILSIIMSPPICAGLLALIIGITPILKSLFFGSKSALYIYLTANTKLIATLTVPMTLVAIGAQAGCVKTLFVKRITLKPVVYVIICRYLIMPIIGIIIVLSCKFVAKDLDWFIIHDPMFIYAAICLSCWPTAIDLFDTQDELLTLTYSSYILLSPLIWFTLIGLLSIVAHITGTFDIAL
ncbi:auxin efflux carrier [Gigaspora rosea]|uniref:Auxin efflux carrier n=1 Tax=Gigaspora rosea TaxID=44941 RepID=A0A397VW66_9GLOM|nr:auxin efflux carrier [Gigaspora rosea]